MPEGPLPGTTVGLEYEAALQATGGKGTLTHSAEGLPEGLEMAADGLITGVATEAGDFTITLTVRDEADQSQTKDFPLEVSPAPRFTTSSVPGATASSPYVATFEVSGGKAPVQFAQQGGELPTGLSFNAATATLAGTPSEEGTFVFTLRATDANGARVDQQFTLEVAPPLELLTTSLPNGNVGVAYTQTLRAQGGRPPLTWSVDQGTLPDGLMLEAATGRITGTPQTAGPFEVTFLVRDDNGATLPLEITAAIFGNLPPEIATSTLPNAVVGVPYSQNLVASEGAPPYTWAVSSGMLPAGLSLSASGTISGSATAAGPQSFQVTLTDANGQSAQKALTLTVYTELVITTASLPEGYTGEAYNQTLSATGGQPPYTWSVAGGALPTGLTLTPAGILSGTPTQAGSFGVTLQVQDASGQSPTRPFTFTLYAPPEVTTTSLANAVVGTNYSQPLTTSGGKPPITWAVTAGTLPAGIQLIGNTLSGTPTAAGTSTFVVTASDANGKTDDQTLSLTVYDTLAITTGTLPDPYVGTPYTQTLAAAGGAAPYTWTLLSGALPAGLSLSTNGTISGTPTTSGTANFTVQVEASNGATATQAFTVTVRTPPSLTTSSLVDGYVGQPYSLSLAASGGKTPYTFAIDQGALPAGLTLSAAGLLSGTPTAPGTTTVTISVTDANNVTATAPFNLGVYALPAVTSASFPDAYVGTGYSQTLVASGGKAPLTWSLASGVLPAGLSLDPATGAITGTPSASGTAVFTARVTDANGQFADAPLTLAVFTSPAISTTFLPDGTLNVAYTATAVATGGKTPLTWSIASGGLPAGLTLSPGGTLSGTPTAAGTTSFVLTVTDANNRSAVANLSITIYAALTISSPSPLPDAYQQVAYSHALVAAGGKAPYSWAVTAGTLPSGLTLSPGGTLSGVPTAPVSAATFTVTVTDANAQSANKAFELTVAGLPAITATALLDGYVGLPYSDVVTAQGGKQPYAFTVTSGALPPGLSLDAATGEITGAPTTVGSSTFEVTLTDANGLMHKRSFVVGIFDAPEITTPSPLADAYVGSPYQVSLAGAGGRAPYTWSVASGTLPAGLALAPSGDLTGTPTSAGAASFSARLTDANGQTATRSYALTVRAPLAITTTTLADGYVGTSYPATTIAATGGRSPYTFAVSGGALPAGMTLSSPGSLAGTPTASGVSSFTVTVTDANMVTATQPLTLAVFAAPTITSSSLPDAYAGTAYSHALVASGGKAPLSWTLSAGALPAGLMLSSSGTISGTTAGTGTFNVTATVTDANGVSGSKALTLAVLPALQISTTTLPDGYVGDAYAATLTATGGKAPYTFAVTAGALPAGLSLTGATLSGTPSAPTSTPFTVTVTDANGATASQSLTAQILAPPAVATTTLEEGYVGSAYSATLGATGGKGPFTWAVTSGALPQGVTLSATGALSGTPTHTGTSSFTVTLTDANGKTATRALAIVILPALGITTASLPDAYSGEPYTATLAASGGKAPYTFAVQTGNLPAGLALSGAGTLSGTPTAPGSASVTFRVTDANGVTATRALTVDVLVLPSITTTTLADGYPDTPYIDMLAATGGREPYTFSAGPGLPPGVVLSSASGAFGGIAAAAGTFSFTATVTDANGKTGTKSLTIIVRDSLVVTTLSLADGYVGQAYSDTLTASGGKSPYEWSIGSGSLPTGLTLSATGALSGTPTSPTTSSFTVRVMDDNGANTTAPLSLTIYAPPEVTTASPIPDAYVGSAYTRTLAATGGKAPLSWSVVSGTLPAGLTLSSAGVLSGTPSTNGTSTFTVQVADANGETTTKAISLTVLSGFFVTTTSLPDGYIGQAYSHTLAASGGLAPYTWSTTSTLPAGLTLSPAGVLSGTPTATGTTSLDIVATDANNATSNKVLTLTIRVPPSITTSSLPDAYVGSAYNQTLAGTNGAPPYTWSVTPALPAGLTLSASGDLSGTPTTARTTTAYTFTLEDANGVTATRSISFAVHAAPEITVPTPPDAYVGVPFSITPTLTGGKAPISWSTTGSVPSWLSVAPGTGVMSGTPTAAGSVSFTLVATDSNNQSDTAPVAFTIFTLPSITTATLPTPYVSVPYSATLNATGGKAPRTWSISAGALPAGLTLQASTGTISGTPTASGPASFTVRVTDDNGRFDEVPFNLTVPPALTLTTPTLPDAYQGQSYSGTVAATGGLAPYTFEISSGTLPSGLVLSDTTGAISGTVSQTATTQSFVIRVTDANGTTASRSLAITVFAPPAVATTTLPDGYVGEAYSQTLTHTGGKAPFNWSISSGTLPAGITLDAATGALSGTPTAAGTANVTVTVSDANGESSSVPLALAVYAPPAIAADTFDPGYTGETYSKALSAAGGKAPLTWSISLGALPSGLTLDGANGTVGGTIGAAGISNGQTYTFTASVTDANGRVGTRSFTMTVFLPPAITTFALTTATEGVTYMKAPGTPEKLEGVNGAEPYLWDVIGLPPGLSYSPFTGEITGIPAQNAAGAHSVQAVMYDSNGRMASAVLLVLDVFEPAPVPGGGTRSVAPGGSPITDQVTVFVVGQDDRPRANIGVRLRKNGVEYAPVKEALTDAHGKAWFDGLGLDGTTDTLDITVNGADIPNVTFAQVNAALVTIPVEDYPLPGKRIDPAGAWDDASGRLIVFGGQVSSAGPSIMTGGCANNTLALDPTGAAWTELQVPGMPASPPARAGATMFRAGPDSLVLVGGTDCSGGVVSSDVWEFTPSTNTWSPGAPFPYGALAYSAIATTPFGSSYLLGGYDQNGPVAVAAEYSGGTWFNLPIPPGPARYRAAAAFNTFQNEAWFCGGMTNSGVRGDCISWGSGLFFWNTRPPLPSPRQGMAMANDPSSGTLYAFGGATGAFVPTDTFWRFQGGGWSAVPVTGPTPPARWQHLMAWDQTNARLVLYGGVGLNGEPLDDVWTFSPVSSTWTRQSPAPAAPSDTWTLSGAITGAFSSPDPGDGSQVNVHVTTSSGRVLSTGVWLGASGTGSYQVTGIPSGDTVTVIAVNIAQVAGSTTWYSLADLGTLGPIQADTTQNIAFPPGPVPQTTLSGTVSLPLDWDPGALPGMYTVTSRPGFPRPTSYNGTGEVIGGAFTASYLPPGTGSLQGLLVNAQDGTPGVCETIQLFVEDVSAGGAGALTLPGGARDRSPGLTECHSFGSGFEPDYQASTPTTPSGLVVDDLDGDGDEDVLYGLSTADIGVLRNVNGSFTQTTIPVNAAVQKLLTLEFDGDGRRDLAVVHTSQFAVYRQDLDGTFFEAISLPVFGASHIATGDFNEDGDPDFIIVRPTANDILVYGSNGLNSLTLLATLTVPGAPRGGAVADMNGDGHLDVVYATNGGELHIRHGDGTGNFSAGTVRSLAGFGQPTGVAVADFDGDGDDDIAVTMSLSNQVVYFRQDAGGTITFVTASFTSQDPQTADIADFNGDGLPDLLLGGSIGIEVLVSNGAGFMPFLNGAGFGQTVGAAGDFNKDGRMDMALAVTSSNWVLTYLRQVEVPVAPDAVFEFTAPANVGLAVLRRGAYPSTIDWVHYGPAPAGANAVTPALPSTLAPSRTAPATQEAAWRATLLFEFAAAPIDRNEMTLRTLPWEASVSSGGMRYVRQ